MKDQQYQQYCRLQEQVRAIGLGQEFDPVLKKNVLAPQQPQQFAIPCVRFEQPTDRRTWFDLEFYKLDGSDEYVLDHYLAVHRNPMPVPNTVVCGVNLSSLDDRFQMIDWNRMTQTVASQGVFKASRAQLKDIIAGVFADLRALGKTPEGSKWKLFLEAKYLSDTPGIEATPEQDLYDRINSRFVVKYVVPFTKHQVISIQQLDDIFRKDLPLPAILTRKHEIYGVTTEGYRSDNGNYFQGFGAFEEVRFFSSLQKAAAHVEQVPNDHFQPLNILTTSRDLYTRMTIHADIADRLIAEKRASWTPENALQPNGNMIQWHLNDKYMPLPDFEQKSGLQLSAYGNPPGSPHIFQVFPEISRQPDPPQQQPPPPQVKRQQDQQHKPKGNRM